MSADALLLGRKTYEGFAAAWPTRDGEFADKFNTMPKYVVSSTLRTPSGRTRRCSTATSPKRSRDQGARTTATSSSTAARRSRRRCSSNDLVDELRLMVFPVVLGDGKRLFGETSDKKPLRLTDSQTVGDGVVILTYEWV